MLPTANRLKKVRDFNLLMKHGFRVGGQFLDIKVLELSRVENYFPPKEDAKEFKKQLKLAIAVGVKISKNAVKRNKIRRQIREIIRLLLKKNLIKFGFYILVVAKGEVLKKDYTEISQEVELLLRRAKLLN